MTTWVPQSPGSGSWQVGAGDYVIDGLWDDTLTWHDDQPWRDGEIWASQTVNSETWTVQGA